ncbi:MAG: protein kinase [Chlamydiales bacterium]|nr:protein kinase [Chlamydiales bacterium]
MNRHLLFLTLGIFASVSLFAIGTHKVSKKELKKNTLVELEQKAKTYNNEALLRAVHTTTNLQAKYKHAPISKDNFLQAAYYIENNLYDIKHAKKHFYPKKKTGLKTVIEHDPVTGNIFLVLDSKKAFIGRGRKKRVYKCIHYAHQPKVLARSEQKKVMYEELQAHKDLLGAPGIMNAHSFTGHKEKNRKHHTIYSDIYQGTLSDLMEKKPVSLHNKVQIMSDLLDGLVSLHSKNYVHRDLHSHNYLYAIEGHVNGHPILRAVISDLGRTIKTSKAKGIPAQMTRRACAPEALNYRHLKGKDYFATDIYALGCIFHRLYHNTFPKWQGDYLKSHNISNGKKKSLLLSKLKKANSKRHKTLQHLKAHHGSLSPTDDLELLILKMLSIKPKDRGTAHELQAQFRHIKHRIH